MDTVITALETLRKARALLVERGWCQGDFTDDAGRLCMYGACWAAIGAGFDKRPVYDGDTDVETGHKWYPDHQRSCLPDGVAGALACAAGYQFVLSFNDADGRTLDEVLAVFDRAIASLEGAA